jgi:phospholipid/cholesterol/gamma-HCH transport system substrate-binding protein
MDREANYVAVGAFVLLVVLMGAAFVLWYSDAGDGKAVKRYEIYFDGSVSGLSEGSTVRYLGVAVGRVMRIGIDPRDPGRVRVVADIQEGTPIQADTVARLALQGVTGLLTINLQPRSPGATPPAPVESLKFPVIPSEQSQFDVLVSSLPDVIARAGEALDRVNSLLSDQNISAISATLGNAERASADLPAVVADARVMFHDLKEAANEMQTTMSGLGALSGTGGQDIKAAAARLREVADTLSQTAARFDRLVAENEDNVDRFAEEGLADFEQLVRETRSAVRSFDALTRSLEQDPSRVIYRPAPAGVEIPP